MPPIKFFILAAATDSLGIKAYQCVNFVFRQYVEHALRVKILAISNCG